jgi:hypothetical protein
MVWTSIFFLPWSMWTFKNKLNFRCVKSELPWWPFLAENNYLACRASKLLCSTKRTFYFQHMNFLTDFNVVWHELPYFCLVRRELLSWSSELISWSKWTFMWNKVNSWSDQSGFNQKNLTCFQSELLRRTKWTFWRGQVNFQKIS